MDCGEWIYTSDKMKSYHDNEWGKPTHDDRMLYEYLFLECMQAGLNWNMMIEKRHIFSQCFDGFDYKKVAGYTDSDIDRIMSTDGMIKSPRKINAMINNAIKFINVINEFGSFDEYLWHFTDYKTVCYESHKYGDIPASNELSDIVAKDLKKRGFKYIGSVTVYSLLQATGVINDHCCECEEYKKIVKSFPVKFI